MTELTPEEFAEIERRFENFDRDTAEVYDVGVVVLTRAMAEREYPTPGRVRPTGPSGDLWV
ncbi:hypothetical protein ACH47X_24180 [Promicromonospora kroppenstedtii]|uniref:Uncharacterized protein n=1 Tax=Promicromonospora kroppenstedtii TaxID=440482 RepID=A0ABW7XR52_9MICO